MDARAIAVSTLEWKLGVGLVSHRLHEVFYSFFLRSASLTSAGAK